jgi:hypothetical protein
VPGQLSRPPRPRCSPPLSPSGREPRSRTAAAFPNRPLPAAHPAAFLATTLRSVLRAGRRHVIAAIFTPFGAILVTALHHGIAAVTAANSAALAPIAAFGAVLTAVGSVTARIGAPHAHPAAALSVPRPVPVVVVKLTRFRGHPTFWVEGVHDVEAKTTLSR